MPQRPQKGTCDDKDRRAYRRKCCHSESLLQGIRSALSIEFFDFVLCVVTPFFSFLRSLRLSYRITLLPCAPESARQPLRANVEESPGSQGKAPGNAWGT